jgi:hypothetical protein
MAHGMSVCILSATPFRGAVIIFLHQVGVLIRHQVMLVCLKHRSRRLLKACNSF